MAELSWIRRPFRAALENAIKGKSANTSPFSIAWAQGKLSRAHLARWAENHFHYVLGRSRATSAMFMAGCRKSSPRPRISCSATCTRRKSAATATPTC